MRYSSYAILGVTVVLAAGAPRAVEAQWQPRPPARFVELFHGPGPDGDALRPVLTIDDPDHWLSAADLPDAAFGFDSEQIHLRVTIGPTDKVMGCVVERASASAITNERACALVAKASHFRHALSVAGTATTGQIDMYLNFGVRRSLSPPAPPPMPPGGYPYTAGLNVVREPDWQSFATPGMPDGEIVIALDVYPPMRGEPEKRFCFGVGQDHDSPLEKATCAAAKSGEYTLVDSNNHRLSPSIKMLVRWQHGKASYRLPSQVRGTPLELLNDAAVPRVVFPAGSTPSSAEAAVTFTPNGGVRCVIRASAGNDQADNRICASLNQLLFTPESDIFGRKIATTRYFHYDR